MRAFDKRAPCSRFIKNQKQHNDYTVRHKRIPLPSRGIPVSCIELIVFLYFRTMCGRMIYSATVSRKSHYVVDSGYSSATLVRRIHMERTSRDRGFRYSCAKLSVTLRCLHHVANSERAIILEPLWRAITRSLDNSDRRFSIWQAMFFPHIRFIDADTINDSRSLNRGGKKGLRATPTSKIETILFSPMRWLQIITRNHPVD